MDLYLSQEGDLKIESNGDLALTPDNRRDDAQQIYIRAMTDPTDFVIYPRLGAGLSALYGKPQSKETGDLGIRLLKEAFAREGRFLAQNISIKAVPISGQAIRFDIYVITSTTSERVLAIEQNLSII